MAKSAKLVLEPRAVRIHLDTGWNNYRAMDNSGEKIVEISLPVESLNVLELLAYIRFRESRWLPGGREWGFSAWSLASGFGCLLQSGALRSLKSTNSLVGVLLTSQGRAGDATAAQSTSRFLLPRCARVSE
jgi:hypothetical protein